MLFENMISIAVVWATAVLVPGPDILVILQSSVNGGRVNAVLTIFGIVAGTAFWGLIAFFGVSALFEAVPILFVFLKIVGGLYLIYVGIGLLRTRIVDCDTNVSRMDSQFGHIDAMSKGFSVNMSNPKTALLMSSFFATTFDQTQGSEAGIAVIVMLCAISLAIYLAFALGLSSASFSRFREQLTVPISRVAGAFFLVFGLKFLLDDRIV